MCLNIVSGFGCFTYPFLIGFTFGFIYFLINYVPRKLTCGCIMSLSIKTYAMKIRLFSLELSSPLPLKFLLPLPIQTPIIDINECILKKMYPAGNILKKVSLVVETNALLVVYIYDYIYTKIPF